MIEKIRLEMHDSSGAYGRADFDLATQKAIPFGKNVAAQVQDLGKGWKRVTLTVPFVTNKATFNVALLADGYGITYKGGKRAIVITEPVLAPK